MSETLSVFDGSTFVVSDRRGDVLPDSGAAQGFFVADTRMLSCWKLTVDGRTPEPLSYSGVDHFAAEFVLVPPGRSLFDNPYLSIVRRRLVREVWREEVILVNHMNHPVEIEVAIEADADFADLFEVKDGEVRERPREAAERDGELVFSYRREGFLRETRIRAELPVGVEGRRLTCTVALAPQERRCLAFVISGHDGHERAHPEAPQRPFEETRRELQEALAEWIASSPRLKTDWDALRATYRRSLLDLAALRFYPAILPGQSLPAAGLPWFMTLFGRDSLITSFQALPFQPQLASTTLRVLAARQGDRYDAFRDEEPGKILHELRFGELTEFGERPHSPYYGTADATPLFLVLLDEYERWSGDTALVRELEPNARAALEWIDTDGDRDGDGYVEYGRESDAGLRNQGWKDSWNAIQFSDGSMAEPPIALCEVQGYVFDAKMRCARLAREVWDDPELADRLVLEASALKRRFEQDFWLEERGYYALALDCDKRPVDALTSNLGHLLWSGIVDARRADLVAGHLMGERMFSGWGVRTMAEGERGYNPIEYHNGTIWPHDNSIIAHGLARYGYRSEVTRLAAALLDVAPRFDHCLPEVFAGYPRGLVDFAAEYPTASRPQAWAAGAPLLLLRALLGLEPVEGELRSAPVLPSHVGRLALEAVPGRWGEARAGTPGDAGDLVPAN